MSDPNQSISNANHSLPRLEKLPVPSFTDFATLTRPHQRYRILVVDDTTDILELLKVYLAQEGYVVQTATNGKQALAMLDEFTPDVICVDFLMPGMDGQELARLIRARQDILYIPIVMLTAVSGVESVKYDSLKSGVDAFLTKPVKREELKVVIRTMLRIKAAQDAMIAALERVAQVQDELLQFERQRGQFEAIQTTVETLSYELTAPLNAADAAAARLEQLITLVQAGKGDPSLINSEGRTQLKDLRNALSQAKDSLNSLSEASKQVNRQFVQNQYQN